MIVSVRTVLAVIRVMLAMMKTTVNANKALPAAAAAAAAAAAGAAAAATTEKMMPMMA